MALEDIVAAMLAEGVTVQEFLHFFTALGLGTHPFIVDVTQQLLYNEFFIHPGTPVPDWTEEEADTLLDVLKSPEPNKVAQADEFEPWSPGFEKDVLNTETYSRSQAAGPKDDDFEPWSPAFEAAVLEHEDMVTASLACIKDGDFRTGHTFYCSRCKSKFSPYASYARHIETHAAPPRKRMLHMCNINLSHVCYKLFNRLHLCRSWFV